MFGDDGRYYDSEAAWEAAYDEGCRAELLAVLMAEHADSGDDYGDEDVEAGTGEKYASCDEIPF